MCGCINTYVVCIIEVIGIRCIYRRIRIVQESQSIVAYSQWLCLDSTECLRAMM